MSNIVLDSWLDILYPITLYAFAITEVFPTFLLIHKLPILVMVDNEVLEALFLG